MSTSPDFERFVEANEGTLRRAVACHLPINLVDDAVAEALAFAYEHWHRIGPMEYPVAYLVRVSRSKARQRRQHVLPDAPTSVDETLVEPALVKAMQALPDKQRTTLWLVHGCGWSYAETAEALGVSRSAVGTHLERGLRKVRRHLGVES